MEEHHPGIATCTATASRWPVYQIKAAASAEGVSVVVDTSADVTTEFLFCSKVHIHFMTSDTAEVKLGSMVAAAPPQVSGPNSFQYYHRNRNHGGSGSRNRAAGDGCGRRCDGSTWRGVSSRFSGFSGAQGSQQPRGRLAGVDRRDKSAALRAKHYRGRACPGALGVHELGRQGEDPLFCCRVLASHASGR